MRIECNAKVAFDPRERILLTDGHKNVVARKMDIGLAGRHQLTPPLLVFLRRYFPEVNAGQLAVLVRKRLGNEIVVDRDALVHRVFFFPRRCFHLVETRSHHDVDLLTSQTSRAAAAIHRGIAAAHHDHTLPDRFHVTERN